MSFPHNRNGLSAYTFSLDYFVLSSDVLQSFVNTLLECSFTYHTLDVRGFTRVMYLAKFLLTQAQSGLVFCRWHVVVGHSTHASHSESNTMVLYDTNSSPIKMSFFRKGKTFTKATFGKGKTYNLDRYTDVRWVQLQYGYVLRLRRDSVGSRGKRIDYEYVVPISSDVDNRGNIITMRVVEVDSSSLANAVLQHQVTTPMKAWGSLPWQTGAVREVKDHRDTGARGAAFAVCAPLDSEVDLSTIQVAQASPCSFQSDGSPSSAVSSLPSTRAPPVLSATEEVFEIDEREESGHSAPSSSSNSSIRRVFSPDTGVRASAANCITTLDAYSRAQREPPIRTRNYSDHTFHMDDSESNSDSDDDATDLGEDARSVQQTFGHGYRARRNSEGVDDDDNFDDAATQVGEEYSSYEDDVEDVDSQDEPVVTLDGLPVVPSQSGDTRLAVPSTVTIDSSSDSEDEETLSSRSIRVHGLYPTFSPSDKRDDLLALASSRSGAAADAEQPDPLASSPASTAASPESQSDNTFHIMSTCIDRIKSCKRSIKDLDVDIDRCRGICKRTRAIAVATDVYQATAKSEELMVNQRQSLVEDMSEQVGVTMRFATDQLNRSEQKIAINVEETNSIRASRLVATSVTSMRENLKLFDEAIQASLSQRAVETERANRIRTIMDEIKSASVS